MSETIPFDARVQKLLEELDLAYEIDSNGDFTVSFEIEGGRHQDVQIASTTTRMDQYEFRDVFSFGAASDHLFSAEDANHLLIHNAESKLGAWEVIRGGDEAYLACFRITIPAESSAQTLLSALEIAADSADLIEEELNEKDSF